MTREAEAERQGGMTAIGTDDDGCRNCHVAPVTPAHDDAGCARRPGALVDDSAPHGHARLELTPGRDRLQQQDPIEIAPQDRAAGHALGIRPRDADAALARQQHPVHAQTAALDLAGDAERAQPGERPRVHRVAAQLVPRKRRAIHDAHARAGAREHQAGHRAGRSRADDHDVRLAQ